MKLPLTGKQWLGLLVAVLFLAIAFSQIVSVFRGSDNYFSQRDFVSDYLTARAVLAGVNPYTPLPELGQQFGLLLPPRVFEHPSPHPPVTILLSAPLGFFNPYVATALWMIVGVLCLLFCAHLLTDELKLNLPNWMQIGFALLAIGWPPIAADLYIGQINLPLLVLLLLTWRALRNGRELAGGLLLGLVIALKLIAWPLALFLFLRRQWRSVFGAAISLAIAHVITAVVFGPLTILHYYTKVGAPIAAYYRDAYHNQALAAWGWRLFSGLGKFYGKVLQAPPLVESATMAKLIALALPLACLSVVFWLAWRARSFDTAFCLLLNASLLAAPVCWIHYFVLLSLPLVLVFSRYRNNAQPLPLLAQFSLALMTLPFTVLVNLAVNSSSPAIAGGVPQASFLTGCLTLLPSLAVLGWLAVVWQSDSLPTETEAHEKMMA